MSIKNIIKEEILKVLNEGKISEYISPSFENFLKITKKIKDYYSKLPDSTRHEFILRMLRDYASENYKHLGSGFYKTVYEISDEFVLKIPNMRFVGTAGLEDIESEGRKEIQARFSRLIPKVYYKDEDNYFIVSQKVNIFDSEEEIESVLSDYFEDPEFLKLYEEYNKPSNDGYSTSTATKYEFGIELFLYQMSRIFKDLKPKRKFKKTEIMMKLKKIQSKYPIINDFINGIYDLHQYGYHISDFHYENIGYVFDKKTKKIRLIALDLAKD